MYLNVSRKKIYGNFIKCDVSKLLNVLDIICNTPAGFTIMHVFSIMLIISCSGRADEANEGTAG